jgi:hypothetical protein
MNASGRRREKKSKARFCVYEYMRRIDIDQLIVWLSILTTLREEKGLLSSIFFSSRIFDCLRSIKGDVYQYIDAPF